MSDIFKLVTALLELILALVAADQRNDQNAIDDALMTAQEKIKAEQDRRKFGKKT